MSVDQHTLEALLQDSLDGLSLPDVYIRLCEVMASDTANIDDAAQILSMDPALSARVLRIANSAAYGLRAQVDSVTRAAALIGLQKLHDLALLASVSAALSRFDNGVMDLRTFWYRSVHCGFAAKTLAERAGLRSADNLFLRGLLHDIGHLLLFTHAGDQMRAAMRQSDGSLQSLLAEERKRFANDGLHLTLQLAEQWHLPTRIVESYRHLFHPWQQADLAAQETALLHLAVQLSHAVDSDHLISETLAGIHKDIWQLAQLPTSAAPEVLDSSILEMADTLYQLLTE